MTTFPTPLITRPSTPDPNSLPSNRQIILKHQSHSGRAAALLVTSPLDIEHIALELVKEQPIVFSWGVSIYEQSKISPQLAGTKWGLMKLTMRWRYPRRPSYGIAHTIGSAVRKLAQAD